MGTWTKRVQGAALASCCGIVAVVLALLWATSAYAAGEVVGSPFSQTFITGSRVGVAIGPGRTTRWLEVSVSGAQDGFLWLLPLSPGGRVDATSHAWLDALDAATRPTVLPPEAPSTCGEGVGSLQVSAPSVRAFVSPLSAGVAGDAATLSAMLARAGASLPSEDVPQWSAVFDAGLDVLVVWYERGHSLATTETLRIVEANEAHLDLPSTASPRRYTPATTFVLAGGPAETGPVALTVDPGALLWGDNETNYAELRDESLESAAGAAWLTESAMPGRLLQPLIVEGAAALPALLDGYFSLAESRASGAEVEACSEALTGAASLSVAPTCPPGALAAAPGPSVCVAPTGGLSAPSALPLAFVCGDAVDAAYALAGLAADEVWLTRAAGMLVPQGAGEAPITVGSGTALSAVVTASGYEPPCAAASGEAASQSPAAAPPSPSAPSDPGAGVDPGPIINGATAASDVADAVAETSDGGCDGDSSDSSSDGGGCDSSSSDSDSSGGCSGDSSSDPNQGCSVHRARHARGAGVKWLMIGALAAAVARKRRRAT